MTMRFLARRRGAGNTARQPCARALAVLTVRLTRPILDVESTDSGAPLRLTLRPVEKALTGERPGDSSQFMAVHSTLLSRRSRTATVASIRILGAEFRDVDVTATAGAGE